ncbi:unnamed protein product [Heligmosomoides polygyrus]|uniref:Metallophos domain-containing protein n=1 Tax=Heligmosomoides polygyrus TaxID=6339 RepID=A0A183FFP6_HELPZ|nr:unnamed protein product [Heligmosomoides polygyrus]
MRGSNSAIKIYGRSFGSRRPEDRVPYLLGWWSIGAGPAPNRTTGRPPVFLVPLAIQPALIIAGNHDADFLVDCGIRPG